VTELQPLTVAHWYVGTLNAKSFQLPDLEGNYSRPTSRDLPLVPQPQLLTGAGSRRSLLPGHCPALSQIRQSFLVTRQYDEISVIIASSTCFCRCLFPHAVCNTTTFTMPWSRRNLDKEGKEALDKDRKAREYEKLQEDLGNASKARDGHHQTWYDPRPRIA
jgi:hypothetical protein